MKGSSEVTRLRDLVIALALVALPAAAHAQAARSALAAADARVALLPAALYNDQANGKEAGDAGVAEVAAAAVRERLDALLGRQLVDVTGTRAGCNVQVACARAAASAAGTAWVVLLKVSKTSNLIWLLTGQLIHVPSGEIVLDDSTELKGEPQAMARIGARSFAERVARTVRGGGITNDFPNGVPTHVGPSETAR